MSDQILVCKFYPGKNSETKLWRKVQDLDDFRPELICSGSLYCFCLRESLERPRFFFRLRVSSVNIVSPAGIIVVLQDEGILVGNTEQRGFEGEAIQILRKQGEWNDLKENQPEGFHPVFRTFLGF